MPYSKYWEHVEHDRPRYRAHCAKLVNQASLLDHELDWTMGSFLSLHFITSAHEVMFSISP